jgi:hypothetical protein
MRRTITRAPILTITHEQLAGKDWWYVWLGSRLVSRHRSTWAARCWAALPTAGAVLAMLAFAGCSTPVLWSSGPQWTIRARCEISDKTSYDGRNTPEQKCGGVLEVAVLRGGQ